MCKHYPQIIHKKFYDLFRSEPIVVCSLGRVNLIGEHTDYNNGLVLPAAINKYIYMSIQTRDDNRIHLFSEDYKESHTTSLDSLIPSGKLWPDYILRVVDQIIKAGFPI